MFREFHLLLLPLLLLTVQRCLGGRLPPRSVAGKEKMGLCGAVVLTGEWAGLADAMDLGLRLGLGLDRWKHEGLEKSLTRSACVRPKRQWGRGRSEICQMGHLPRDCGLNRCGYSSGPRPYLV